MDRSWWDYYYGGEYEGECVEVNEEDCQEMFSFQDIDCDSDMNFFNPSTPVGNYFVRDYCPCACPGNQCPSGCPDWWIGDSICDPECNNMQCNYDNGDCDGNNNNNQDYESSDDYGEDEDIVAYASQLCIGLVGGIGLLVVSICGLKRCACKKAGFPTFNGSGIARVSFSGLAILLILIAGALNDITHYSEDVDGFEYTITLGYLVAKTELEAWGMKFVDHTIICDVASEESVCPLGVIGVLASVSCIIATIMAISFSFCRRKFCCTIGLLNVTSLLMAGIVVVCCVVMRSEYLDLIGGEIADVNDWAIGATPIVMILATVILFVTSVVQCVNNGYKKENDAAAEVEMAAQGGVKGGVHV